MKISLMDRVNASALMLVTPEYSDIKRKRAKSAYRSSKPTIPALETLPMKRETIEGISIRYAHEPAEGKPTLILLCPLPQSIVAFSPIWKGLIQHVNLYAYDLPGFGQSEGGKEFMNFEAQGRFLGAFVDHFDLRDVHLVGPDLGMPACLYYAGACKNKVKSMMIGDGPGIAPSSNGSVINKMVNSSFWRMIFSITGSGAFVEAGNRLCYVNYSPNPAELSDYKRSYAGRMSVILEWFKDYPSSLKQLDPVLESIQVPSLIFWGEDDHLLKVDNAYRLKDRMPNSTLHVFKDCGHFSYQDAHSEFQNMVIDWVQDHGVGGMCA